MKRKDARYEDAGYTPLRLMAVDVEDLQVLSALTQDSLFLPGDIKHMPGNRQLALLLNRIRWENTERRQEGMAYQRIGSVLLVRDVLELSTNLRDTGDAIVPYSLLALECVLDSDGTGQLKFNLAGHWDIEAEIECINLSLVDVTQPYTALAGDLPKHGE